MDGGKFTFLFKTVCTRRVRTAWESGRSTCDWCVVRLLCDVGVYSVFRPSKLSRILLSIFFSSSFHFSDKFKAAEKLILPNYKAVFNFIFNSFRKYTNIICLPTVIYEYRYISKWFIGSDENKIHNLHIMESNLNYCSTIL